ncbi:OsmC family peroxiredoxin [Deinococcus psychrotolerans]|uniref:OsmC family peroxiredoxin n=1 Tax=Deinococcus psychrotolerans TaxID=2489213 RepID=A0A3G8YDT7_9DEIO|nr:OsmC family protein [Deinococcus psychrotolerans]AZI43482.1 OsmC family peroxiredoxin [Deinococcus psychrotolerans]
MATIERKANARWTGDLRNGKGTLSSGSGVLQETPYSFHTRFEDAPGTNPEELLAAAHSGCFTMQLSALLAADGHPARLLATDATCVMEPDGAGFKITKMKLMVRGSVDGLDPAGFEAQVTKAAEMCPLSQIMKGNVEIEHEAVLEN